MFDRFLRHLLGHKKTLASFGASDIESFWLADDTSGHGISTRMRYLKLLDRMCRHLVYAGIRHSNPASEMALAGRWPDADPTPLFLPEEADVRLQEYVAAAAMIEDVPALCACAIVALLLATGITAAECQDARSVDLHTEASPPYLHVPARGSRPARTVELPAFALPALTRWQQRRPTLQIEGALLFSMRARGTPVTVATLGNVVRSALLAIKFEAEDLSPRVLRNTYGRRLLLAGVPMEEVAKRMGLTSHRTCERLLLTIDPA
ncbi:tyrosine-type recombinase/integrase [Cupriavidus pampae]|uniref:Tyr recombinase domain-containing protein n=1 Tax=Cupriavidus pampae TaxID=659251 RepID=A0ABM8Y083_9BURK|nr:site-specific integrase [Cupriavidus pampae]CAG9186113.1 hypothetical protein LMG32289_06267 [Cupriavidus pampae]